MKVGLASLFKKPFGAFLVPFIFFVAALPTLTAPFTSRGESREALVVRNMLEQQDFILPLRNGAEIPSKPPLFHWGGALLAQATGELAEWKIRLPSAVFALIGLLFLALFATRAAGPEIGLMATLICATSFEWLRSSALARVDMVFAASMSAALWLLFEIVSEKSSPPKVIGAILFLIGALLSKGPAGLLLPIIIIGAYLLLQKKLTAVNLFALGSIAVTALTLGGAWYFAAYQKRGVEFLEIQLLKENVTRLTGDGAFEVGHEKPFYFAPLEFLVATMPWGIVIPALALRYWRRRREQFRDAELLSLCAVVIFLIVCSVAASKRPVYFLGVLPFCSFLIAMEAQKLRTGSLWIRRYGGLAAIVYLLVSFSGLANYARASHSPIGFSSRVREIVGDAPLYQSIRAYYPFMYYFGKDIPIISNLSSLAEGGFALSRPGEEKLCEGCRVVVESDTLADDGRRKLLLIQRSN